MAEELTAETTHEADDHIHSDTVELFGRTITVTGGIYTVVFGALGILTLIEVLLSTIENDIRIVILLALAIAKAVLVILFYMHLKNDNRLFAVVLLIPLLVTLLSVLFLLTIPPTGYTL